MPIFEPKSNSKCAEQKNRKSNQQQKVTQRCDRACQILLITTSTLGRFSRCGHKSSTTCIFGSCGVEFSENVIFETELSFERVIRTHQNRWLKTANGHTNNSSGGIHALCLWSLFTRVELLGRMLVILIEIPLTLYNAKKFATSTVCRT